MIAKDTLDVPSSKGLLSKIYKEQLKVNSNNNNKERQIEKYD
jgi:hypothetical protein